MMTPRMLAASAAVALFAFGLASGQAAAKETVKVGFIGPLTGGVAANGIGGRNSADLAVRLHNADPNARYEYEFVALDDECKPNTGVQAATKLAADKEVIAAVTHYCSAVAIATVDVYHKFGLPVVVWGAVLPDITYGNNYKEIHRVNGTMINQNEVAAKFMTGLGYKTWAIIYFTDFTDRDAAIAGYRRNNAKVREIIPADRLLVFNVADGWAPLCDFLGVPVPDQAFPHKNVRREFWEHFGGEPAMA